MTREIIVEVAAEQAVIRKPPNRIVWPTAKAPLAMVPSLQMGRGILPDHDGTEELSMKPPMSVSKPADLHIRRLRTAGQLAWPSGADRELRPWPSGQVWKLELYRRHPRRLDLRQIRAHVKCAAQSRRA